MIQMKRVLKERTKIKVKLKILITKTLIIIIIILLTICNVLISMKIFNSLQALEKWYNKMINNKLVLRN
jgi:hypothetical protein